MVEDEGITAMELQRKLNFWGYDVPTFAFSRKEAIKKAKKIKPDLVLIDIILKGDGDGIEAAQDIKDLFDIPIIFITALNDKNIKKRAQTINPSAYIVKPFNDDDLHENIENALHLNENEKKVLDTGKWLDKTLKDSNKAIIVADSEGHVKFMNNVSKTLTGYKTTEHQNDLMHIFNIKMGKKVESPVKNIINGDTSNLTNRVILITRENVEVPIEFSSNPILGDHGEFLGATILFEDISQRIIEESRLELKQKFSTLYLQSPQAIGIYNEEGKILEANPTLIELFGASDISALNKLDLFSDFDVDFTNLNTCNEKIFKYVIKFDFNTYKEFKLYKTSESGISYLEAVFSPIDNENDSQNYLFQLYDITENRLITETLLQSEENNRELQDINDSLEDQIKQQKDVNEKLNNDINGLKKEIEANKIDFNEKKENLEAEINSLKELEKELQNNFNIMEKQVEEISNELSKTKNILESEHEKNVEYEKSAIKIQKELEKQIKRQKTALLKLEEKNNSEILKHKEKEENLQKTIDILQKEIKEKTQNFNEIKESLENTKELLDKKEKLLKTFQKQVKKDINMISSLSGLQYEYFKDQMVNKFNESQNYIKSIALVHEKLYSSDDLEKIDFNDYVHNMINDIIRSYGVDESQVTIKINVEDIYLDLDTAVSGGLIISELVSNSLKHAFTKDMIGTILIEINCKDNEIAMDISDNGVGLPKNLDFDNTNTLGLQLIKTLVSQMEGNIQYKENNGSHFAIRFKKP